MVHPTDDTPEPAGADPRARFLRQLLAARSVHEAMKAATEEVVAWVECDVSWVAPIVDGHLLMGAHTGLRTVEMASSWTLALGEGIGGRVALDGIAATCRNYAADPRRGPVMARVIDQEGILATLTLPVYAGEHIFGVIYAADRHMHDWTEVQLDRMGQIAQTLSACVASLREVDAVRGALLTAQEELAATDRAMRTTELVADSLSLRGGAHRALEILAQDLGMTVELRQREGAAIDVVVADRTMRDPEVRWTHIAGRTGDFAFVVRGNRELTRSETRLLRTSTSMIGGLLTDLAIRARSILDDGNAQLNELLDHEWHGPSRAPALFARRPNHRGAATDIDAGLLGDALESVLPHTPLCRRGDELVALLDATDGIPHIRDKIEHGILPRIGSEPWVVVIGEACDGAKKPARLPRQHRIDRGVRTVRRARPPRSHGEHDRRDAGRRSLVRAPRPTD
ncbi:GAF domain-containing protein [Microbacterium sp. BR1]|uniref:GAF domain-containing protein n=1 Tax=Microbacterium sp. BR1 TaxID=1070896 RepID=UPI000C2BCBDF|nr:GAF domain-containing protein [Microbacterium sp. BR1]